MVAPLQKKSRGPTNCKKNPCRIIHDIARSINRCLLLASRTCTHYLERAMRSGDGVVYLRSILLGLPLEVQITHPAVSRLSR